MVPEEENLSENLRMYRFAHDPAYDVFYQGAKSNYLYYCDEVEILNNNEVFIPYRNYFSTRGHHLKFGTEYELIFVGTITFSDGSTTSYTDNDPIATFQTERIPNRRIKSKSTFTSADVPKLGFSREYLQDPSQTRFRHAIYGKEKIHNYAPVSDDNITGDNINVAIVDLQIFENSVVNKAVVYKNQPQGDEYFIEKNQIIPLHTNRESILPLSNHGTQMARYMLNYAPGINIYGINKSGGTLQYNIDTPSIITDPDNNIDIASFSGSSGAIEQLGEAIHSGLIVSRSLGNKSWILNTPSNYEHKDRLLPYYSEWLKGNRRNTITGAYVTLQAVYFDSSPLRTIKRPTFGFERTTRSEAGSAQYYTLSIVENGNGATSEATATFSGMVGTYA